MTHIPTVIWLTYLHPGACFVNTTPLDGIEIGCWDRRLTMSRTEARLLAKRINQCLDETSSRGKYGRHAAKAASSSAEGAS